MSRYELTARAVADLQEIARYTKKTWGPLQAERYGEELEIALQQLAIAPDMGRTREAIVPGMRSFPVAGHIAFYAQHQGKISILRMLHPRMDVDDAFEKDG